MSMKSLNVAIFGIGPAAMAAAHAVQLRGGNVHFMANSLRKSDLYGCQFLHKPLPADYPPSGFENEYTVVNYDLIGDVAGYRRKVYGEGYTGSVSPEVFLGDRKAYDLRASYARLWQRYLRDNNFTPLVVTPGRVGEISDALFADFDLALSTVPANNLCLRPEEHTFNVQEIYAIGDAPDRGVMAPVSVRDNIVLCNGHENPTWYRASRIFGHSTVEWPSRRKPPFDGVKLVKKPIWTDCNCYPMIQRIGRYGAWRKSVLVHDVFEQVDLLISNMRGDSILTKRRDWCFRCGAIAISERPLREPAGITEYKCPSNHTWDDHGAVRSE